MVSGPAGIGKTRLVTALVDRLCAEGKRVLSGACLDLGAGAPPYSAFIAAFRSVDPPAVPAARRADRRSRHAQAKAVRIITEHDGCAGEAAAHRAGGGGRPLVGPDHPGRPALFDRALAREGRWAVVVTFRDDELRARPAVREFLDALNYDALLHIELDALSSQDVAALMEGIAGERPTQQDAERVHRRSGGVPLLVEEVVAAQAAGMTGVPDHLRDLFLVRLQSVGEPAVRAASVVAVMGDRCDERPVADALEAVPTGSGPLWTARSQPRSSLPMVRATGCATNCWVRPCTRQYPRGSVADCTGGSQSRCPKRNIRMWWRWPGIGTTRTSRPRRRSRTSRQPLLPSGYMRPARHSRTWKECSNTLTRSRRIELRRWAAGPACWTGIDRPLEGSGPRHRVRCGRGACPHSRRAQPVPAQAGPHSGTRAGVARRH
jgi:hypothetical protein